MRAKSIDRRIARPELGDRKQVRYVVRDPRVSRRALAAWTSTMPPCAAADGEVSRCAGPTRWSASRLAIFPPEKRHHAEALQGVRSEGCRVVKVSDPVRTPWPTERQRKAYHCPTPHPEVKAGTPCRGGAPWFARVVFVLEHLAYPVRMASEVNSREAKARGDAGIAVKTSFVAFVRDGEAVVCITFRHRATRALRRYLRSVERGFGFRGTFERVPHEGRYRGRVRWRALRQRGWVVAWNGCGWEQWVDRRRATWSTERGAFVVSSEG